MTSVSFASNFENVNLDEKNSHYVYIDCDNIADPLESINRKVFIFNSVLDYFLLRPIAKVYSTAPRKAKIHVQNFVSNIATPLTFVNNLMQLNFSEAMKSFWKFAINSTIGIFGIYDLTTARGLDVVHQTFGNTLAYYGARPGIYIVLPILGSTNLRDMFDVITLNNLLNPLNLHVSGYIKYGITAVSIVHKRAAFLPVTDSVGRTALDPYVMMRSMIHQRRHGLLVYPSWYKCKQ